MTSLALLQPQTYPLTVGRYVLFEPIASGGMASVHIGRLQGSFGFTRTVAIKRLHQSMALDPEFLAMFLEEARLAARIRHTNVVQTLDVVALQDELLLIMEYVSGAALSGILAEERQVGRATPHRIAVDVMVGVLNGLHAAHEAKSEDGLPLDIVHRDVSPQNILIGTDGVARVLDFGIAKAVGGTRFTRPNEIKGKLRYLPPESITGQSVTRASDIYSASVVLWEMLAGRRLFEGKNAREVVQQVLGSALVPPSHAREYISRELDDIVMCGLNRDPSSRHATAREMALALEAAVAPVNRSSVSAWALSSLGDEIRERDACVARIERETQAELGGERRIPSGPHLVAAGSAEDLVATQPNERATAHSISMLIEQPPQAVGSKSRGRFWGAVSIGLSGVALAMSVSWWQARRSERVDWSNLASAVPVAIKPSRVQPAPSPTAPNASSSLVDAAVPTGPPVIQADALLAAEPVTPEPSHAVPRPVVRHRTLPKRVIKPDRIYRRD